MSREGGSPLGLAASFSVFVAVGAAAALFLWRGLNEILEGRSPPASVWIVVALAAAVLILLAVRLARTLRGMEHDA